MEKQYVTKVDLYKMPLRNANCTCGDCEHFSDLGCWQAAEALALDGYPRAVVLVKAYMSAESCPSFEHTEASKRGEVWPEWKEEENDTERGVRAARGMTK